MAKQEKKEKRADLPRHVAYTREFQKAWERYKRAGRHDMHEARDVMATLFKGEALGAEYLDHELVGEWDGSRECHIRGDFLLIYQDDGTNLIFVALGTHAELFG
ncbi:type II toxin-antitoxin system YafQ family toxin [Pseudomonas sp. zfem005]|uniref:type II toxin-antitoxin system YafQ family toxin n=1 Tax=Pseudomonas sp. zfem005 TaxID=3078200 RepID=UPI002929E589|nr:type II toxin-antitoxin system YafQ family toxin [Pseudomonas sp. zfem005]MDU9415185.1 type II toxin-antitoxin system YafQ family toxin [Pseudomonas sp. zfem005]